jgi:hypothetical protein
MTFKAVRSDFSFLISTDRDGEISSHHGSNCQQDEGGGVCCRLHRYMRGAELVQLFDYRGEC